MLCWYTIDNRSIESFLITVKDCANKIVQVRPVQLPDFDISPENLSRVRRELAQKNFKKQEILLFLRYINADAFLK